MALKQLLFALGTIPMPAPKGSDVVSVRMVYDSAIDGVLALNDVIELGFLPDDCVPVDWVLDADDLDSNGAPAIVLALGILTAAKTAISAVAADGGAAWAAGLTTAQAGGVVRPVAVSTWRVTPTAAPRSVGIHVTTAAATAQAGKLGFTLSYRAAYQGK